MTPVIELAGVGKRYDKLEERGMLLRSLLPFRGPRRHQLWALRELDLQVSEGETVGVLGHNGAGKTTLLRLLAGVTSPTTGRLRVVGRIAPLISLGVGFHPEMSGRENVMINGMLLGLTRRQVAERFDDIVEFSELGDFIDTPVKFYSSGMSMRLGFAVIAHVEPRILLVDEILAVGDAGFQFKCFERLRDLQRQGAAIVMVSHSTHMIRQMCRRAILIRSGRLEFDGDIETAIAKHTAMREADASAAGIAAEVMGSRLVTQSADRRVSYDDPITLELRVRFHRQVSDPVITAGVRSAAGLFGGFNATPPGTLWRTFHTGEETAIRITFPARLGVGDYELVAEVKERTGIDALARVDQLHFSVVGASGSEGIADLRPRVELETR